MALKTFIKDLNEVVEALREHYTASEGGFVLITEDGGFKKRIDEFRSNNIALTKKLEAFSNIDPDHYKTLAEENKELKKQAASKDSPDIEKIKTEYEGRLTTLSEAKKNAEMQAQTYRSQLHGHVIDNVVAKAVSNVGKVQKGALTDILSRARSIWKVNDNGVPVAMNGDAVVYGAEGKLPLTAEEWAQQLLTEAPYLFEPNAGGGAGGSSASGSGSGGKKQITRAEYRTGKYIDDVAAGKIEVID